MNFASNLSNTIKDESSKIRTENGAIGYSTTGRNLVDINFAISSLRKATDSQIIDKFNKACRDNLVLAIKWLFYARDIRGGVGERRLFRVCLQYLANAYPANTIKLIPIIAEYGRFDDLFVLLNTQLKDDVLSYIKVQLAEDMKNCVEENSVSLLAKWLPSINTSSPTSVATAKMIAKYLGWTDRQYRKVLARLRQYIDVIEVKMTAKKWGAINYNTVPSKANLIYKDAFLRNDEARRREYLNALTSGKSNVKINSATNFPCDIAYSYRNKVRACRPDATLEALWKALPNYITDASDSVLTVVDGSGSMGININNSDMTAHQVADSIGIYFAEKAFGDYHDKIITFGQKPQWVDLSSCSDLCSKLSMLSRYTDCSNTNIKAVFNMVLRTAVSTHAKQEEIPSTILIISDMEFDSGVSYSNTSSLFREIEAEWNTTGYKMPKCVFWNVASRSGAIPVNMHEKFPVTLVSGFSPAVCKMVLSNKTDPYEALLEQINAPRYDLVERVLNE